MIKTMESNGLQFDCQCRCCSGCQRQFVREEERIVSRLHAVGRSNLRNSRTAPYHHNLPKQHKHDDSRILQENKSAPNKRYLRYEKDRTSNHLVTVEKDTRPNALATYSKTLLIIFVINSILSHLSQPQYYHRSSSNEGEQTSSYLSITPQIFAQAQGK